MAVCFGATSELAAFIIAFRWANFFRRLVGEGALLSGFVPHFEELRHHSDHAAARFLHGLGISLILFFIVFLLGLESILGFISPSLSDESQNVVYLVRVMLPSLLFLSLYTAATGFLHCHHHFFRSSFSPVMLNVIWTGAIFALRTLPPQEGMTFLASAILAGYIAQWLFVTPPSLRYIFRHLTWKEILTPTLSSPHLRALLHALSLGMLGVGAVQLNTALDTLFARAASLEGPAYLSFAIRPQQLPLALISISIASSVLPALSRAAQQTPLSSFTTLLTRSLEQMLTLMVPCTVAMVVVGDLGINLLYGHGSFTLEATYATTKCLWGYALGLLPMSATLLLAPAFFANKDYWTPTYASLLSVALNIALNAVFVFLLAWGPASLALSTGLSAFANAYLLWRALPHDPLSALAPPLFRLTALSLLGGTAAFAGQVFLGKIPTLFVWLQNGTPTFSRHFPVQLAEFLLAALLFSLPLLPELSRAARAELFRRAEAA